MVPSCWALTVIENGTVMTVSSRMMSRVCIMACLVFMVFRVYVCKGNVFLFIFAENNVVLW